MAKSGDEVISGKKFPGEKFSTVKTVEQVNKEATLQKQYDVPNAIPLSVYFSIRRINDPVQQKMMESFTTIRKATKDAFDEIFATF